MVNKNNVLTNVEWNGTAVDELYGGTGQTSFVTGDILYASASNVLSKLAVGSNGDVLQIAGGVLLWDAPPASSFTLSDVLSATGSNAIDNGNYPQAWQWNLLTAQAFQINTNSTTAAGNAQTLIELIMQGANAIATQRTHGIISRNEHTGATSTNVAGYFSASGGTNNYALIVPSAGGNIGFGTLVPSAKLDLVGTFQYADGSEGTDRILTSDSLGNATWADGPVLETGWFGTNSKTLNSSPIELLAAPAAGFVYHILAATFALDFNSVAYDFDLSGIYLVIGSGGQILGTTQSMINAGSDNYAQLSPQNNVAVTTAAINIKATADATVGNSMFYFKVYYKKVALPF